MTAPHITALARRKLVWLLWLAMLLPLAQLAGASHLLSHKASQAAGDADSKQALHQVQCELCVTAAAVVGGAPGTEPQARSALSPQTQAPEHPAASAPGVGSAAAYASRAPPSLSV